MSGPPAVAHFNFQTIWSIILLLQCYRTICVKLTWPNNFITRHASRKGKFCVIFNVYYA